MKSSVFLLLSAISIIVFTLTSCKDEKVPGCTDKGALNFSGDAQIDDGTCSYPRDKFTGNYSGIKSCSVFGADSAYTFKIEKSQTNKYEINLVDFPESAASATGRIDDQNLSRFIIPSQPLVNGLDSFSVSGEGVYLNNKLTIDFYRISTNSIDTCHLKASK